MRTPAVLSPAIGLLAGFLTSCLSSVHPENADITTVASSPRVISTYDPYTAALHAEANRLMRYNASLTPKEAAEQAAENVNKSFYPETNDLNEIRELKRKAAQAKFEEEFLKAMKK
jgi:hypothetical protein